MYNWEIELLRGLNTTQQNQKPRGNELSGTVAWHGKKKCIVCFSALSACLQKRFENGKSLIHDGKRFLWFQKKTAPRRGNYR